MASTISRERVCLNRRCSTSSTSKWRSGWLLSTGHFADLCDICGLAFEQSRFCESFHLDDTGWRHCNSCGQRVHCGCVASLQTYACLDAGGIECKSCIERKGVNHTVSFQNLKLLGSLQLSEHCPASRGLERARHSHPTSELGSDAEDVMLAGASDISVLGATARNNDSRDGTAEASHHTGLHDLFSTAPSNGDAQDDRPSGLGSFRSRPRQIVPRPAATRVETSTADAGSGLRAARLPVEGRGRTQLLPRYWPRITDKELQQISGSGDNKSTITPLFEKVLSASDAGRIGRLVLPKACAEAYFPQISQPEGVPMKIQDVTGKVWGFQFRFWPNNNSRMYVLEGVTPCIQKLQLQAGDTVTFSRMEPGGRLVMGYRRAPTSAASLLQDQLAANVGYVGDGIAQSSQSLAEGPPGHNILAKTLDAAYKPPKVAKLQEKTPDGAMLQQQFMYDWKRSRPLGSKTKRLRIENEESVQLKSSWEEVQELLRPPVSCAPHIVSVEGHEFEEYEEPPVLAKKTLFTLRNKKWAGDDAVQCNDCDEIHMLEDQWAWCDNCAIWRRVPADSVIPAKWTCSDNQWDPDRASCSEPQEVASDEIEHLLLTTGAEYMRQGVDGAVVRETTAVGLDALADAAALREEAVQVGAIPSSPSSPVRTTKHPRHRPGCTCIVCIQPPSGKGPKHKATCSCNVCVTVKRRFKTLMMRKKRETDTRGRKRKAFQYVKDGTDGEQIRIGPSKQAFRIVDNSSFGRLGVEMQEPSGPFGQVTSLSGIASRKNVDRDGVLGLKDRDEMIPTDEDHSIKIPSIRLELSSDKSAANFPRATNAGEDEGSWRSRPSQIDLNMQPDVKSDDMHEKLDVDGEHGVAGHPWHTGAAHFVTPSSVNCMQPPSLMADGNSSRGKLAFDKLEHMSCSRSPIEGRGKTLQIGEATSRASAKGVESDVGSQQAAQFAMSSYSNSHSMVAES